MDRGGSGWLVERIGLRRVVYRLDEPLMWGALPLRCFLRPDNMRWALGSHDIVFKNRCGSERHMILLPRRRHY